MHICPSGFRSLCTQRRFFCNFSAEKGLCRALSISDRFASGLENCSDVGSLKKLHACMFTHGFGNSIFLGSKLLNCYAEFGFLTESKWVCDKIINNNLSLWNSILVGYFRSGHFYEVLKRYLSLKRRKIGLDSSAITFSLKSCTELWSLEFGQGIHVDAYKFGLNTHGFVGSSLINLYLKFGDIVYACEVFDEIIDRDVVVYTSMITGYAQIGDHRAYEAFRFVHGMTTEQINPNRVTLISLLQVASKLGALEEGQSVHGYALRREINCFDEVFETSLVDMYIKCGAPKFAARVFGQMNTRTTVSWNAVLAGHLQMGQPFETLKHFSLMVQENVVPDLITLANGILSCANLKDLHKGKSIHCHIIRSGVQLDLVAATALVDMYSKCNCITQARELFDRMEERDAISFNVMMTGYLENGLICEAIETFCELVKAYIKPNQGTILTMLSALSDLKDLRKGRWAHGYVLKHRFGSITEIANQVIYMYAKCGCVDSARKVFCGTKYKDLVSYTAMMMACVSLGQADEAIFLFRQMQRERLYLDSVIQISLLQAFAQLGCLSLVKEVHCHIYRVFMDRDVSVINSLITTYAKCGILNIARNLFEHATTRCLASWNTMIAAYGMHGDYVEVLNLFDRMKNEKVTADEVTFTSILSTCSHSGLVEEGLHIFRSMTEKYSIIPREEHFGCMVDLLSRAGRLREAFELLKFMPSRNSALALGALHALLAACRVHQNTEMGKVIGRQLLSLHPDNSGSYALVSNLYAEDGKWDVVARIRCMAKGLKRTPGCSLIENRLYAIS